MSTNQFVVRNTSCDSLLFFLRLVCCTDYAVSIILEKSNGDILLVCLPFYHRHCFISPLLPLPATSGNQTCFNLISVLMEADWRGLTMSSIKQSFPNHWTWQTSLNSWWLLVAKTTFGDHCCRKCGSRDLQIAKWLRTICSFGCTRSSIQSYGQYHWTEFIWTFPKGHSPSTRGQAGIGLIIHA